MNETTGPFTVRKEGHVAQEILDRDGKIIAWAVQPWVTQVIYRDCPLTFSQRLVYSFLV